jgi:hypothetical protein
MTARSTAKVAALLLLTAAPNHRVAAYPLIEASGVDPFALAPWGLLVAGDHLCGPNASGAVLLSSNGSLARLLRGPTPHVVGSGAVAAGANWQAGVVVGTGRVVLLRGPETTTPPPTSLDSAGRGDLAVLTVAEGCSSITSVQWAWPLRGAHGASPAVSWAGAAVFNSTAAGGSGATLFSIVSGGGAGAARLVAIDLQFGACATLILPKSASPNQQHTHLSNTSPPQARR